MRKTCKVTNWLWNKDQDVRKNIEELLEGFHLDKKFCAQSDWQLLQQYGNDSFEIDKPSADEDQTLIIRRIKNALRSVDTPISRPTKR